MKIAMIGQKRIPSRKGGIDIVVEELSTRLVKNGNTVVAYNRKGSKDENPPKNYNGIKIIEIPVIIHQNGIEAFIYSLLATIKALFGKYDVIHYHAEGPSAMIWLPHLFKIRTVVTIHGLDWQRAKWGKLAKRYIKFGEKMAAKYADEIIVLSNRAKKYFKKTYNRETNFIPNGVNKIEIRSAKIIKDKYKLEKDSYILFLARIVPEKGLHYLIEAFKKIDTDKKLVITGDNSCMSEYLLKIKELIKDDDRIIMTGFVQGEELEELFSNCYLYCLPSDIEGMPISLLEAMSLGCDCLVSDIPENVQVGGNYVSTFKRGNVKDLTEKLKIIIGNKPKNNKKELSNYINTKYNWDDIVKRIEKLYQK